MENKTNTVEIHQKYMQYCLTLAEQALIGGNPPVGAIIVCNGQIIGEGIEAGKTNNDVTDHAEILAIRDAISKGYKEDLKKSILYSTHEPCIMCAYPIRVHAIPQLVIGVGVDHIGGYSSRFGVLQARDVPVWSDPPEVLFGCCEQACLELNERYISRMCF